MNIRERLGKELLFLDGGMGTLLQAEGLAPGELPETWNIEHPEKVEAIHRRYYEAGSDVVLANTFGANVCKFHDDRYTVEEVIRAGIANAKRAGEQIGKETYVALDMGPTGKLLKPMGDLDFDDAYEAFAEAVRYGEKYGADLIHIETMSDTYEVKAAILAAKENSSLPVFVTMIFDERGKLLTGGDVPSVVAMLEGLRVDALGLNCGLGPKQMLPILNDLRRYTSLPIIVKPNAGLPKQKNGETYYDVEPDEFARIMQEVVKEGACVIGGCCGTTPEHIASLVAATKDMKPVPVMQERKRVLASERQIQEIDINGPFLVIGERINPTGKKELQESLRQGSMEIVCDMAEEQEEMGAHILDINMGMNGIDEKEMMLEAIEEVTMTTSLPLCFDSSHVDIIEAALRRYPGRALINSISLEKEKFEKLLPIAKKYGAMFILLPLSDAGLPKDINEKKEIIHTILARALELGMHKEDIVVDGLVATVGANKNAALETLETICYCKNELGLATVGGLSNISFGLPNRAFVNAAFVTMALQSGLTMAIANPSSDIMMNLAAASDLLLNKAGADLNYINRMAEFDAKKKTESVKSAKASLQNTGGNAQTPAAAEKDRCSENKDASMNAAASHSTIYKAVLNGSMKSILDEVKAGLAQGMEPGMIVSDELIPAINEVGDLFEQQKYFLPQLIASAETMKKAIEYLEPMLSSGDETGPKVTIVIATVEGDIHDIGKNLVALMLKNYGFRVVDLGKDVPKEDIVQAAIDEKADIIALSALMTTTMMRMKDVVELVKEKQLKTKVIIGGAVITQSYADEIGADGYSKDAADAVRLVQRLLGLSL